MAGKITKELAMELIPFAKKLHVSANYWDPTAKSAFEFCRQMASPKLKKKSPSFDVEMVYHELNKAPTLYAEFSDGSKWNTETTDLSSAQLRLAFYERAMIVEELAELANMAVETEAPGSAAKGKPAAKNKK